MSVDWTPERIEQLKELWQAGLPTGEIGRRLGVTKNAVVGKVHRLGLPKRPSPIKRNTAQAGAKASAPASSAGASATSGAASAAAAPATPRKKKPAAQAKPKPKAPDAKPKVITLGTLKGGMCSWPLGDPGTPEFRFCGKNSVPGKPYCLEHCNVAYVRSAKDRERDDTAAA